MLTQKALGTVSEMWADSVSTRFSRSLAPMLLHSQKTLCGPNEFIHFTWATVSYHEMGRQELVEQALGDWIFQTDTDHVFAPDLLVRLLHLKKKYNCRVISGLYGNKYNDQPVANVWRADGGYDPLVLWDPTAEVIEIGPCGGGCLLVDLDVFREVQRKTGEQPFKQGQLSEDYMFFKRCRDVGIKTWLAPQVQSHHLKPPGVANIQTLGQG